MAPADSQLYSGTKPAVSAIGCEPMAHTSAPRRHKSHRQARCNPCGSVIPSVPCVCRMRVYLTTPLTVTMPWPLSLRSKARTTAWLVCHVLYQNWPNNSYLRAEESVCQYRVAVVAMAESDELKTVDDDHVACREHDVVNTVHVEGGGAANAAGKAPFAIKENGMPRRDKSRSRA